VNAVWYRLRAEFRARRRSMLAIAVLLGLGGGAVMAAAAGARRTDSAYPRLLERTAGAHLAVGMEAGTGPSLSPREALADPRVVAVKSYRFYLTLIGPPERCGEGGCLVGLADGGALGGPIDGMKLVKGRLPEQNDPSEVVLTIVGAEQLDLKIGDRFPLRGVPFGEFFAPFAERVERQPLTMRIVGIVATPGDLPPQIGDETVHARFTQAFYARYPEPSFGLDGALSLRLIGGADDIAPFLERVFARYPETFPIERAAQDLNVQRSFHLQALALWALAGVAGITILLIASQAIGRELLLGSDDTGVLATLGMTRLSVWILGIVRAGLVAVAAAVFAVPGALMLSTLFPRGLARAADPSPGFAADWTVLGVGAAAVVVLVFALAAWPAYRVARIAGARASAVTARARPSLAGGLAAGAGASPAIVAGTRMALEPGSGRTAVPVRTTIIATALGVATVVAALSFGSSLDHLLSTPRLYGVSFDMAVGAETVDFEQRADEVLAMPEIEGIAWGFDVGIFAGGAPLSGIMMDTDDPSLEPPLLEGRAPRPAEQLEAVLGVASARRLRVGVGDTFEFQVPDAGIRMRAAVVGLGALPTFQDSTALSDGVWFSHAGVVRAIGAELPADKAFIDLAPGADATVTFHRIAEVLGVPVDDDLWRPQIGTPADLVSFGNVRGLPLILALLIASIAVGMLAHAMNSMIRRRARDIAILKSLGFTRRQARATVLANATVLAIVTALIGVPAGIIAGRLLWRAFADAQGILGVTVLRWWIVAATVGALLVLASAVAVIPARTAARTRPAALLRAE